MSQIPKHKHNDKELSELRTRSAMQSRNNNLALTYEKKIANRAFVILGYALPLVAPIWILVKHVSNKPYYSMADVYIMAIPILLALMIALWIALRCVLSRHNSAFIFICSLLCCFSFIYAWKSDKNLQYELRSLVGSDKESSSTSEPALEVNSSDDSASAHLTPEQVREMLDKEKERVLNRKREMESEPGSKIPGNE